MSNPFMRSAIFEALSKCYFLDNYRPNLFDEIVRKELVYECFIIVFENIFKNLKAVLAKSIVEVFNFRLTV
jgi:hypothetical protein